MRRRVFLGVFAGIALMAGVQNVASTAHADPGLLLIAHGAGYPLSDSPVFQQDQLQRASELKLGVSSPEAIHFLTTDRSADIISRQISGILALKPSAEKSRR